VASGLDGWVSHCLLDAATESTIDSPATPAWEVVTASAAVGTIGDSRSGSGVSLEASVSLLPTISCKLESTVLHTLPVASPRSHTSPRYTRHRLACSPLLVASASPDSR
jgi:hypothetical protein